MRFSDAGLADLVLVELEPHPDERGFFARTFCRREFVAHGLPTDFVQQSLSFNEAAGTLRGMHYQRPPHAEGKIVRCTRGAIHDVVVDLRPGSPTHQRWRAFELTPESGRLLYIPPGFAHGFQTLAPATEVTYQMTEFYVPGFEAGFAWDDPHFAIAWPLPVERISVRDSGWPPFVPGAVPAL